MKNSRPAAAGFSNGKTAGITCGSLLFFLVLLLAAGCRGKSGTEDLFGENLTAEKLEPVTLTIYFMGLENPHVREVLDEAEKRTKNSLNVKLDFRFVDYRDYARKLEEILVQGDACDMFMTASYYYDVLETAYVKGAVLDITRLLPKYAPKYFNKLDEGDLSFFTRDGKILGVPSYLSYTERPCAIVREDLFRKYNLQPIRSLDDFENYLELVKKTEEKKLYLAVDNGQPIMNIFAGAFGYTILDQGLGLVYKRDDPEMKLTAWEQIPEYGSIVERVYGWYRKGFILKDYFFLNMQVHMDVPLWSGWIANQLSVFQMNSSLSERGVDYRYLEFPLFPETPAQRSQEFFEGLVVNARSKNPERALMFLEWVHANQENYDLMRYGIKGKHYVLKGEQFDLPENMKGRNAFVTWQNSVLMDIDYERINVANSESYMKQLRGSYRDKSLTPRHLGFRANFPNNEAVRRRISLQEIEKRIGAGSFDSDTIDNYIAAQKAAGTDGMVAEIQAQLDEWRKNRNGEK